MLEKLLEKGEKIEIHYLSLGQPKIEIAILKSPLGKESFQIGNETGQHIVYWDRTERDGKRSGVRLIKNKNGEEIYRNDEIPFNYESAKFK